ncbi:SpaH/EbpB family LPXTG-anchored major pilin [Microbacterium phyllosphaerae]|uniref:SpaH/EbpB family LPXTG-anchored major pilin n=1 Tax=Microbacterium phyllosphaerae TaxID=124798 RepID=UPI003D6623F8
MKTITPARRGTRAVLAASAAAILLGLGLAAPAAAAPLVDPDAIGSITIHKLEAPDTPSGLPNNGTAVDTAGLTPLPGIEFQVRQVTGIDLSTNSGWTDASALSGVFDAADPEGSITGAGHALAAGSTLVTDAAGEATFTGLPVGLYLVEETDFPAGVTPSAPFLISVPLTDPTNLDNWLYDVHVYPKNAVTTATKTVEDADAVQLGDEVTFTITADIPNVDPIDGFKIVDVLDVKLDYVATVVTLADGTTIAEGVDYAITHDAATNTVTVEFTAAGRAILAAHNTTSVVVDIVTTVNTVGEIANQALVYPNLPSFDIDPGEPGGPTVTPEVETRWGGLTIEKVGQGGAALTGAVFQVYTSAADAAAQTNPVTLAGATDFEVVNADGTLTIAGLRYSDFANGATVAPGDAGYLQYYLVEVQAPDGYELLAEPIEFTITAATTAAGIDLTVINVPHNGGFQLPFTGGTGTGLLYLAGIGLIAGGVVFLVVKRRRSI